MRVGQSIAPRYEPFIEHFSFLAIQALSREMHTLLERHFLAIFPFRTRFFGVLCEQEDIAAGQEHWDLAPAFSKTLIWMSLAHHTEPWQEHWRRSAPPPPPNVNR